MIAFPSAKAVLAANLPRTTGKLFRKGFKPKRAYLYVIISADRYDKIGVTTHPAYRIPYSASFHNQVERIGVIGPSDEWKHIEDTIVDALAPWADAEDMWNRSDERFDLTPELHAALWDCFVNDCQPCALGRLVRLATAPPIEYQI